MADVMADVEKTQPDRQLSQKETREVFDALTAAQRRLIEMTALSIGDVPDFAQLYELQDELVKLVALVGRITHGAWNAQMEIPIADDDPSSG